MTTVEKLNYLISIKSDIKTAIENKGVDMTGVSFLGYASKIGEIVSGIGYTDRDVIEGRYQYNISNSASFVYSSAFEYKSVQTVDLPNCLYVGSNGFYYCTNLTTVSLPACTDLHRNAFRSCSNLNTIYMGIGLSTVATMRSSNALLDCSALQSIYVPASLVDKYKSATNWSYYSSIIYPFDGPSLSFDSTTGLLSGYCSVLLSSAELNSFLSDNNIDRASITQVSLPYLTYFAGFETFAGCSNLISVSLPVCDDIGAQTFQSCTRLSDVYIPNCSTVEAFAFRNCEALQSISLPVCDYIGIRAFQSTNLNSIVLGSTSVCIMSASNAFDSTPIASGTGSIYVPASLVNAYKSATNWSQYSNRIYSIR